MSEETKEDKVEETKEEQQEEVLEPTPGVTRNQLLARSATKRYRAVKLLDGLVVRVQSLTAKEDREWRKSWLNKNGDVDPAKWAMRDDTLIAVALVGDDGKPMFTIQDAIKGVFDEWDAADKRLLAQNASDLIEAKPIGSAIKN
jgi:hypothetical protein